MKGTEIKDVRAVPLTTPYGMEGAQTRRRSAVFVELRLKTAWWASVRHTQACICRS